VAIRSCSALGAQSRHSGAWVRGRRDKFVGASSISTPMTFIPSSGPYFANPSAFMLDTHTLQLYPRWRDDVYIGAFYEPPSPMLVKEAVKSWVPRGTCPAYFCLLVPRVQATVSHNHEED
jgi:hypothetical protein